MAKAPVRFSASLPALLSYQIKYKRVTKTRWALLPKEAKRTWYDFNTEGRASRTVYEERVKLEPYPNPYVTALRKRLTRDRVQWVKSFELRDDVTFINFSTIGAML